VFLLLWVDMRGFSVCEVAVRQLAVLLTELRPIGFATALLSSSVEHPELADDVRNRYLLQDVLQTLPLKKALPLTLGPHAGAAEG